MVDYRGPQFLKPMADAFDVPIFDRVSRLDAYYKNFDFFQLSRAHTDQFPHLQGVSITKRDADFTPVDLIKASKAVADCRVKSANVNERQFNVVLNGQLGCAQ